MRYLKLLFPLLLIFLSQKGFSQYVLENSNIPIIERLTSNYHGKELTLKELDEIVKEISQEVGPGRPWVAK